MRRLALAVLLVSSGAAARSDISRTDVGPDAKIVSVRGELKGAIATFRVGYVHVIAEPGYATSVENLELPATGLITAATVRRDGVTHRLDLVHAGQATKQWEALAAEDAEHVAGQALSARTSAVLIEGSPGAVTVSMATPRAGRVEIELEITVQTCFFRDARHVVVPASWAAHTRGSLKTAAAPSDDLLTACGFTAEGAAISFAAPEVARRRSGDRLGAYAGRLVAGEDHIVRVELDLAAALADIPRDLVTVLVVDGSRSMTDDQRETQRELVMSYLRKAPDSRVQVIAYARTARPLLPSWSIASRSLARVDRELRALAPRNGSNLDAGLAEAGTWLAQLEGTRRIVLVTDELMGSRLQGTQAATLKRALPAGTLVHVVSTLGGSDGLFRDDEIELAPLAAATDGIAVRAAKGGQVPLDATMLVRPITIDQVTVTAPGWTKFEPMNDLAACGAVGNEQLAEGHACSWWGEGDLTSGPVVIAGLMWGRRITRVLRPDPSHGLEIARELSMSNNLAPDFREHTELMARGVNAQWSFYGAWGGAGRYYEGFGFGISGMSCCGGSFSSSDSIGIGRMGTMSHRPPDDLSAQLAPAVAACELGDERARVQIELTLLEIVEVTVEIDGRSRTHPNDLRKLRTCVEDVIWDASPMIARPLSFSVHSATFGTP